MSQKVPLLHSLLLLSQVCMRMEALKSPLAVSACLTERPVHALSVLSAFMLTDSAQGTLFCLNRVACAGVLHIPRGGHVPGGEVGHQHVSENCCFTHAHAPDHRQGAAHSGGCAQ